MADSYVQLHVTHRELEAKFGVYVYQYIFAEHDAMTRAKLLNEMASGAKQPPKDIPFSDRKGADLWWRACAKSLTRS